MVLYLLYKKFFYCNFHHAIVCFKFTYVGNLTLTMQYELKISVLCSYSLCFLQKDKMLIYPWMWTKIFETVLSLVGTVLLAIGGYDRFIGLMSVSLICLCKSFVP